MKPYRVLPYSADPFDHWRLSQVGGSIDQVKRKESFIFKTKDQFDKYLALNSQRK